MTPADRAMKMALDESVQYHALSTPDLQAIPLVTGQPLYNLTGYELNTRKFSQAYEPLLSTPTTLHPLPLRIRKSQQASPQYSTRDLDYKRVRRKQSFSQLFSRSLEAARPTSSKSSAYSTSVQSLIPQLLPPLPLTPSFWSASSSPSLSSTVDTLQSTPTHTPIQTTGVGFQPLWESEKVGLREPIRTKRKFSQFKRAKRLPHHTIPGEQSGVIWRVHAAVIDVGGGYRHGSVQGSVDAARRVSGEASEERAATSGREIQGSGGSRAGRTVRFEGLEAPSSNSEEETSELVQPSQEKDLTQTSSFSLSKFKFPPPPGYAWDGIFGKQSKN